MVVAPPEVSGLGRARAGVALEWSGLGSRVGSRAGRGVRFSRTETLSDSAIRTTRGRLLENRRKSSTWPPMTTPHAVHCVSDSLRFVPMRTFFGAVGFSDNAPGCQFVFRRAEAIAESV